MPKQSFSLTQGGKAQRGVIVQAVPPSSTHSPTPPPTPTPPPPSPLSFTRAPYLVPLRLSIIAILGVSSWAEPTKPAEPMGGGSLESITPTEPTPQPGLLSHNYLTPNTCKEGYFYIYQLPATCYPNFYTLLHDSAPENPFFMPKDSIKTQHMASAYLTQHLPAHPCYTPNPRNASAFVAVYWGMLWRFRSPCCRWLDSLIRTGSYSTHTQHPQQPRISYGDHSQHRISDIHSQHSHLPHIESTYSDSYTHTYSGGSSYREHPQQHVFFDFFAVHQRTSAMGGVKAVKDCGRMRHTWVDRVGNAAPQCNTPIRHCPLLQCEISGMELVARLVAKNASDPHCTARDGCYLVATHWRESLEDRQHLVLGVWGVKKNAQKLRGELQRVLQALPGGLFVPVNEAKSPPHAARFEAPPLNDSVFCLVPKGESPARRGFSTCIMMGSIPIICSDNFIPPYHTMVNWSMASFRIPEHTCAHFVTQLAALGEERTAQMHKNVLALRSMFYFDGQDGEHVTPGRPVDMTVRYMFEVLQTGKRVVI